jgi:hypothetical protein
MNSVTRKSPFCYILAFCYVAYLLIALLIVLFIPCMYQGQTMPSIEEKKEV